MSDESAKEALPVESSESVASEAPPAGKVTTPVGTAPAVLATAAARVTLWPAITEDAESARVTVEAWVVVVEPVGAPESLGAPLNEGVRAPRLTPLMPAPMARLPEARLKLKLSRTCSVEMTRGGSVTNLGSTQISPGCAGPGQP